MATFGKRDSARPASGGGAFEMYLKTFDDGQNRVSILEDLAPEDWISYYEHFDMNLKISYPCAKEEGAEDCVGCSAAVEHPEYSDLDAHFPDSEYDSFSKKLQARKKADPGWGIRDKSKKFVVRLIDDKNYISLYKIGVGLRDDFQAQYKVLGSLKNNEWVIVREGKGFNTEYKLVAVPGEVRKPKYPVPDEQKISETLGAKYNYALEKYGYEPDDPAPQPDPAPQASNDPAPADEAQAGAPATGSAAPAAEVPAQFIPREASLGEIKDFLKECGVEYPERAPRNALVTLAEKAITERAAAGYAGEPPF